jgi:exodeoxyribonuclease V beta subunit
MSDPQPFDLCGELPSGTTVLEASAGTGKTYTIAALAVRYIAEGIAELSELMLVTFGRMATNELRLRVRERMVSLEAMLSGALSGGWVELAANSAGHLQPVERLLLAGDASELNARHSRIVAALAEFDAATIATTHEFCLSMLDGLGVLGDREPQARFVEELTELTREVAGDLFLRRYATNGRPPLAFDQALDLAETAVNSAHALLVPSGLSRQDHPEAAERHGFACGVRAEVERRKLAGRLFTYDDMLTRLRDVLADPVRGPAATNRLRNRYRIVLVDEFQDTDPIQWDILRRAFHGHSTLVLVGDPKQAIYAFRGADVFSYLDAVTQADSVRTLATNWRSDAALVDAVEALAGGAALGDPRIVVRSVTADQKSQRLLSASGSAEAAFRLRVIEHAPDADRVPPVAELRPKITADLVADVGSLLASGATLTVGGRRRAVDPADVAVLVRTNERGDTIRDALIAAGIPAIMLGASSVYASSTAEDWLILLTALEQPRQHHIRRAALTCFFGWTFDRLATASEPELIELIQQVRSWARILRSRGVAALMEAATTQTGLPERLLRCHGGERQLTDLRHIGQTLHAAMVSGQLGISALVQWLGERMAEARRTGLSDRTRRLETDARAVAIMTVHASKGLEFPVVYLPDAWDQYADARDDGRLLRLHETSETGTLCELDVGGLSAPGRTDRFARHLAEDAGEQLRLLYVAMTRAQCSVVTWWAPSRNTPASALHRFLYRPVSAGVHPAASYPLDGDPRSLPRVRGPFSIEPMQSLPAQTWQRSERLAALGQPRIFNRTLDLNWRRTSYSSLTAAVHGAELALTGVSSEPEPTKEDDESSLRRENTQHVGAISSSPDTLGSAPAEGELPDDIHSPMEDLPVGIEFGTVVHAILEAVDPLAEDLAGELRTVAAGVIARTPAEISADALSNGLLPAMQTPLGPLAGDRRLCDIPRSDRLAELSFELPLAGGDQPITEVRLSQLAPLLRRHLAPADLMYGYSEMLEHPVLGAETLRGYLTGSIDAVLRLRDDGVPRYLIMDYKTNWLGSYETGPLLVTDYSRARMAQAMLSAHYPLQALLYSVAVHRLLRWRQPEYRPEVHLGGVLYLFLRGMAGPKTPRVDDVPYGVFSWRPPAGLIMELSDLLQVGPP